MGGRSSNFSINKSTGQTRTQKTKIYPLTDEDSISEINNDYIDILQDKNHIVCHSTDNFNYDLVEPNLKKLNQMIDKFPGVAYNLKGYEVNVRGALFDPPNVSACFEYYPQGKEEMTIWLNKDLYTKPKQLVYENEKATRQMGYFSKSDDNELLNAVISHEYGHFIEKLIIDKKLKDNENFLDMKPNEKSREFSLQAAKIKHEILKIEKERFNSNETHISDYGEENAKEFFAEAFANLATSKNPTNIAKATEIYVKENL